MFFGTVAAPRCNKTRAFGRHEFERGFDRSKSELDRGSNECGCRKASRAPASTCVDFGDIIAEFVSPALKLVFLFSIMSSELRRCLWTASAPRIDPTGVSRYVIQYCGTGTPASRKAACTPRLLKVRGHVRSTQTVMVICSNIAPRPWQPD
jgi:hypothetical protein